MNGAECLLRTLAANRIDLCLMNPGTSEMQFVSALDRVPGVRGVLCLFEGVCSGAADGYARMTGRPASTLLHLGPGMANAISNFHNARKARSPVVNIVGEHATQHLRYDAPLTSDIAALARTFSASVTVLEKADGMGAAAASAIAGSRCPPGRIATLIVPADYSWSEAGEPGPVAEVPPRRAPDGERIRAIARLLRAGEPAGLYLGGSALLEGGLKAAARLAAATGTRVVADRFSARMERGRGRFNPPRIAYFPEAAEPMLAGLQHLVLVETEAPVSFFAYPGRRSTLAPEDCAIHVLASAEEDGAAALEMLAAECGAESGAGSRDGEAGPPPLPRGERLTTEILGAALAALLPEGAIVSDEAVSSGEAVGRHLPSAAPHTLLPVTGGSIGQGLPVAVGAALACPGRKVVALEADGSGMYTLQSLWTMAREGLDVVAVILANRRYRILEVEMRRTGAGAVGPVADRLIDLGGPPLDWVQLSRGQGVPASRASTADEFIHAFRGALAGPGPHLVEAVLEQG